MNSLPQHLLLSEDEALKEAERCLLCRRPFCASSCPAGVDIPGFIKLIIDGKPVEAGIKILERNILPASTALICPQDKLCEGSCILGRKKHPISIGRLQFYAAYTLWKSLPKYTLPKLDETNLRIAVIGSGPAGISAAAELARRGCEVVVYEKMKKAGGMLRYGIPSFRLPREILDMEIEHTKRLGVQYKLSSEVGVSINFDDILNSYDGVIIATGLWSPRKLGIPGEESKAVIQALNFLLDFNLGKKHNGKGRAIIIGGGDVAMDAARAAVREGWDVTVYYRRTYDEMPASKKQIEKAVNEGVKFKYLASPIQITDKNGYLEVVFQKMKLGPPDESGRRRPIPLEETFKVETELLVPAIGQLPDMDFEKRFPGVKLKNGKYVYADQQTFETSAERVYAAGDLLTGPSLAIKAIKSGKLAALSLLAKIEKQ